MYNCKEVQGGVAGISGEVLIILASGSMMEYP